MSYAKWTTKDELSKNLTKVNLASEIKVSGVPMMYDDKNLYIDDQAVHTLIVGSTGSGKTEATILPTVHLSMLAKESFIIYDKKGEIYQQVASQLKKEGYHTLIVDFENSKNGHGWNPLILPYHLYKNGNKDAAMDELENIGYYLFEEKNTIDSFWTNSAIHLFIGLALYLFDHAREEEINFNSIYELSQCINEDKVSQKFVDSLDKFGSVYYNLSGILCAPIETKGGIISVFNQKMNSFVAKENLSNMLANDELNIENITKDKTAIFIVTGMSNYANRFLPLFVNQAINSINNSHVEHKRINIFLDEFDDLMPIRNFADVINYSRSLNVRFIVTIKGYVNLINTYGKEDAEIIQMCFGNIIYLLSSDIYTLTEISKLCGKTNIQNNIVPLITVEELKVMPVFEAVILKTRMMPYRGKLLPNYKIDYGYQLEKEEIPKRNINPIKIFQYHNE